MRIAVVLLLFFQAASYAQCSNVKALKSMMTSSNFEYLSEHLKYPINARVGGSSVKVINSRVLVAISKSIFTQDFISQVETMSEDEFAFEFGVNKPECTLSSLELTVDSEELRYARSGISSSRKLFKFLEMINQTIDAKRYSDLENIFWFPFYIEHGEALIKIENSHDYSSNEELIFSPELSLVLKKSLENKAFIEDSNGLILDKKGSVWIVERHGSLYLQVLSLEVGK
ncbi:hypothetical protein [Pseudoalteromonas viridis]|uniref:Uncharacterized protein n=1 Tax=Pseudoalteromonas viridis TaxID=339617 RepID=A0ABX7V7U3_9GAMM|nr:hypothetical protein [Pseudoalteromonas viridis]QTL36550.1 hypothetical protein J5X90_05790 [Pseudoalteromonas viridis]